MLPFDIFDSMQKIKIQPAEGLRIKKPNSSEFYNAGDEVVITRAVTKLIRDGDLIEVKENISTETKSKKKTSKED